MNQLFIIAVIDSPTPPQWVIKTLEDIDQRSNMQLGSIIVQATEVQPTVQPPSKTHSTLHRIGRKLLYGYINRPRFNLEHCATHALTTKLASLIDAKFEISESQQSLVLHLGDIDNKNTPIPDSTHGIWMIKHNALIERIEEAILFRHPLLWVHLWCAENDKTSSLKRISSHSLPMQSYSISDAISYGFGTLPDFITSRLNWLAQDNDPTQYEAEQINSALFPSYAFPEQEASANISAWDMFWCSLKLLALQTQQRVRDKTRLEQWQMAFTKHLAHPTDIAVDEYTALTPPSKTIWADPHMITHENETHVFFEALDFKDNRGRIDWAVLTENGFTKEPKTVLTADHHLSYPFVFEHESNVYMIPETAANRCISLYRAKQFPEQWEHIGNIMDDVDAADSTLFQHEGLWWMFTNGVSHPSVDERDQLMLFYTDDFLSGNWTPHPLNPVVTGIDRARMAGGIYSEDGKLYRPSQYGATRYGFGVNTSVIHQLTKTDYKETLIDRVTPTEQDAWIGCHTFVRNEHYTVVDRLKRIKR